MRILMSLAMAAVAGGAFANFVQGNLVVAVVGDGGQTTPDPQAVSLRQFTTSGAVVGTDLALNGVNGRNVSVVWGETSEANLSITGNGQYFMIAGYDIAPRGTGFNVLTTPRVVARIDMNGTIEFSQTFVPTAGDGVRNVWSDDGGQYWITGGDLGIHSGTFPNTPVEIVSGATSTRTIKRFRNGLLFNGSNAFNGSNGFAFLDGNNVTELFGTPGGGSARDFVVVDDNTLYIATSSTAVGLVKMTFDGTNWTEAYRLSGQGISGLAFDGSRIYATLSNGTALVSTTDTGTGFSAWQTLATAGTNTRFRGVEVVPEPASLFALGAGLAALAARRRRKA